VLTSGPCRVRRTRPRRWWTGARPDDGGRRLEALVRRFSQLLEAHPELESIDINPAVIYEDRYVIVDAKGTARA